MGVAGDTAWPSCVCPLDVAARCKGAGGVAHPFIAWRLWGRSGCVAACGSVVPGTGVGRMLLPWRAARHSLGRWLGGADTAG